MNQELEVTFAVDVHEYQKLKMKDSESAFKVWRDLDQAFRHYIERHHGRQLATVMEASYLADFPGSLEALACAVELQLDIAERREKFNPTWREARLRIGINDTLTNLEIHKTAPGADFPSTSLLASSEPGGICMSRRLFGQVRSQLDQGVCKSRESAPEVLWRNIGHLWDRLESEQPDRFNMSVADLRKAKPVVTTEDFLLGDVYIDYPYEDAKFRYEKDTQRVYRRFYGEPEMNIPHDSILYHEAIAGGKPITRDEYFGD